MGPPIICSLCNPLPLHSSPLQDRGRWTRRRRRRRRSSLALDGHYHYHLTLAFHNNNSNSTHMHRVSLPCLGIPPLLASTEQSQSQSQNQKQKQQKKRGELGFLTQRERKWGFRCVEGNAELETEELEKKSGPDTEKETEIETELETERDSPLPSVIVSQIGSYAIKAQAISESLPPEGFTVLTSCVVGLMTGVGVVLFNVGVHEIHDYAWQGIPNIGSIWYRMQPLEDHWLQLVCVPTGGGMIVGVLNSLRSYLDVTGKEESYASKAKAFFVPVLKALAATVTLGTGNSLGPEGPSVEIGASIAGGVGNVLRNSRERKLSLIASGSAAGISSGFNAAVAGCFFAVESVLRQSSADSASSLTTAMVILSSVVASVVSQAGLGSDPAFKIPAYDFRSPAELPLYLLLGILCGLVSVALTKGFSYSTATFDAVKKVTGLPAAFMPPLGGLCVGLIALLYPGVLYWGFENVDVLLESRLLSRGPPAMFLLQLVGAKIVATSICRGSGLVGGVYAPSLFLGAALGSAYGKMASYAVSHAPPIFHLDALNVAAPQAYALVGMAAMLSGVCQVPLTSVLLLFELTRDYRIILPLMGAVGLSSWVASTMIKKKSDASVGYIPIRFNSLELISPSNGDTGREPISPSNGADSSIGSTRETLEESGSGSSDGELCTLESSLCLASGIMDEDRLANEISVEITMRTHFVSMPPSTSVQEVLDLMIERKEWCALLVHDGDVLVGLVTLSDIQQGALGLRRKGIQEADLLPVWSICKSWVESDGIFPVVTVFPDMSLKTAQGLMERRGLRQIPVVSRWHYEKSNIKVVLGLLDRDDIRLACRAEATKRLLKVQNQRASVGDGNG